MILMTEKIYQGIAKYSLINKSVAQSYLILESFWNNIYEFLHPLWNLQIIYEQINIYLSLVVTCIKDEDIISKSIPNKILWQR